MKKFLLILFVVSCIVFVACTSGSTAEQTTAEQTPTIEEQTPTVEGPTAESEKPCESSAELDEITTDKPQEATTTEEIIDPNAPCTVLDVTATELSAGDEFTFTVSINNNPGIFSFTFEIPIDNEVFDFVSASTEESICSSFGMCGYDTTSSSYKFNGYGESLFENLEENGQLVSVTLKVKDNAEAGTYLISVILSDKNIINVDAQKVAFRGTGIQVIVSE